MSNRHLPAGQNIQGGVGGVPGVDMPGGQGGPRRRQPPPYVPQYPPQQMSPMYAANFNPYAQQQYYGMPPYGGQYAGQYQGQYPNSAYQNAQYGGGQYGNGQYQASPYQNGGMHSPGYVPYPGNYGRPAPQMSPYVPMAGVSISPGYHHRQSQQSPALSTPYQPPPAPAPIPPQTPSSTHSSQLPPPPTPPTPQSQEQAPSVIPAKKAVTESVPFVAAPSPAAAPAATPVLVEAVVTPALSQIAVEPEAKAAFRAPLPWLSRPELEFPPRTTKLRRRRRLLNADSAAVSLPVEQHEGATELATPRESSSQGTSKQATSAEADPQFVGSKSQQPPKEFKESAPLTPTSPASVTRSQVDSASATGTKTTPRVALPALPVVPALPKASPKEAKAIRAEKQPAGAIPAAGASSTSTSTDAVSANAAPDSEVAETVASAPAKVPPSSWAKLFAKPTGASGTRTATNGTAQDAATVNGTGPNGTNGATNGATNNFAKTSSGSVAEAVQAYKLGANEEVPFLEPRGLINTGNMCYMNSVLQVLMFCIPFYDFLNQVGQRAAHSFKSDTPLVDAMIMFMREFKIVKSESSALALRRALKNEELERYGEPFTPEFVYEAIRQLPRFASMRRGHQQDAEEFLGFLLQSLDDECTTVINSTELKAAASTDGGAQESADDWLEVGRKQRAAVTRSSGTNISTPITKIFGGLLRSEFRVPGLKDSITTEPYQPLQLDIQAPDVRNVVDALRGLTRPERIHGDFNSARGKDVVATKQVFIETLPPILILHLKRFQFDAEGNGTIKIWKKIGYPLELEIPREALSRQSRQTSGERSLPKYRLVSVVYHHGKNATGGHYTVDVRRQDGHEWIRIDDTAIRRVRSEDVAEGGEEEEIKEPRRDGAPAPASGNRFGTMNDEDMGDEDGWKQVTTTAGGNKRWSNAVNDTGSGASKAKQHKDSIKDNKIAYLLFYQRM